MARTQQGRKLTNVTTPCDDGAHAARLASSLSESLCPVCCVLRLLEPASQSRCMRRIEDRTGSLQRALRSEREWMGDGKARLSASLATAPPPRVCPRLLVCSLMDGQLIPSPSLHPPPAALPPLGGNLGSARPPHETESGPSASTARQQSSSCPAHTPPHPRRRPHACPASLAASTLAEPEPSGGTAAR